jgi:hypothetical protein
MRNLLVKSPPTPGKAAGPEPFRTLKGIWLDLMAREPPIRTTACRQAKGHALCFLATEWQ